MEPWLSTCVTVITLHGSAMTVAPSGGTEWDRADADGGGTDGVLRWHPGDEKEHHKDDRRSF
ncbi:MAG TPA: hypothetical protein VFG15_18850 [Amycolatopsis sp.]|nr:hypothetical protein [Amycolatopsis sp.]